MTDSDTVISIAKEIRTVLRSEFGKHGDEGDVRRFLEDGLIEEFEDACSADELEEAVELAVDMYLEAA